MRESRIEKRLLVNIERLNGICLKCSCIGFNGMPDRMVVYHGKVYFVELKAPGEIPRKLQRFVHKMLADHGFDVYIIDSLEGVEEFIHEIQSA